jgi:hypothetical protein
MNQELQLGKYEFYPNDDELKRLASIDSLFEKDGSDLDDKSVEDLLKEIRILRAKRRKLYE